MLSLLSMGSLPSVYVKYRNPTVPFGVPDYNNCRKVKKYTYLITCIDIAVS